MSFDTILAKSPFIIYKPGGVTAGLVVSTWAEVQQFIAFRQGTVIVYVDDSIVTPALVPGASGVTDCQGRVEFRPAIVDSLSYSVLRIEDGATLHNVYAISDVEIRCNSQSATPSMSFSGTPTGGTLLLQQFGALTMAATATQPGIRVPAGTTMLVQSLSSGVIAKETFVDFTVPLFDVPVTAAVSLFEFEGSLIFNNFASGAGAVSLGFDNTTAAFFAPPGTPPALPGITGAYSTFDESVLLGDITGKTLTSLVVAWRNKPLDAATMGAPAAGTVPVFDGATWKAQPSPTGPTSFGSIIYKPGAASAGDHVATWPEVQAFIATTDGKCIVYVDDSIVSPALVPGATGVTDCLGRVELRPHIVDSTNFVVLQIENGATLRDLYQITAMEVRCNTTGATPALDFTSTSGGNLYIREFGLLSNAATATQPALVVAGGKFTILNMEEGSFGLNVAVPFVSIQAGGTFEVFAVDGSFMSPGIVAGAGNFILSYDTTSETVFGPPGIPPMPGLAGTYRAQILDPNSVIYKPGLTASFGRFFATWAEVKSFIALTDGTVVVYVDDSIVSPALVPAATGITDCQGRVTVKSASPDSQNTPVLQIESGATLRNLSFIVGVEVQSNATAATPSLDYTTPNGGNLSISEFGALSNAATATQPAVLVPAGQTFFLHLDTGDLILNAPAVPLFSLAATATLTPDIFNASVLPSNYAAGAGDVFLDYDDTSAKFFTVAGVPSPLPGLTGTYKAQNLDAILPYPGPQSQATWFIDPQNVTGLADDNNSGIDATHPVLSYNFGVARKWTTYSPTLRQNTTLTWLSSQVGDTDPVVFTPIMVGAVATLQGSLGAAQQIHAGNLAGVVSKNRAAGQLLEADLGFAAPIGSLVQNTQAGKSSYAWVYKNVAGTVFALSQPIAPIVMPIDFGTAITEVDTWANGDTFVVFTPIGVNLVKVDPVAAKFSPTFAAPVQTYHLHATSADGVAADANFVVGTDVSMVECSYDSVVVFPSAVDDLGGFWTNDFFGVGLQGGSMGYAIQISGGAIICNASVGNSIITFSIDKDTIVDGIAASALWISSASIPALGAVYIAGGSLAQGDFSARLATIWGPGSLDIIGASRCFYTAATGAVATFLNTGGLLLNGQANANAFDPTSGLWSVLIPITAANLDLAFGAGGFGGLATNVGGASFSSQGFP